MQIRNQLSHSQTLDARLHSKLAYCSCVFKRYDARFLELRDCFLAQSSTRATLWVTARSWWVAIWRCFRLTLRAFCIAWRVHITDWQLSKEYLLRDTYRLAYSVWLISYSGRVVATFWCRYPDLSLPWHQGRSEARLSDIVKLADPENPILVQKSQT